MYCIKT